MVRSPLPPHLPPPGTFDPATGLVVTVGGTTYNVGVGQGVDSLILPKIESVVTTSVQANAGVHGESQSKQIAGVSGINNNGGIGVSGSTNNADASSLLAAISSGKWRKRE